MLLGMNSCHYRSIGIGMQTPANLYWHPFHQPAACKVRSRLVLKLLCVFHVCASALITCTIITSCTLLPCDLTLDSITVI